MAQLIQIEAKSDADAADILPLVRAACDRIAAGEVKGVLSGNGGNVVWERLIAEESS